MRLPTLVSHPARWWLVCCFPLLQLVASPASADELDPPPDETAEPDEDARFHAHLSDALTHFKAGKYEPALAEFERALRTAPATADRATLEFNAAACLYELARYPEAEARFVRAAELDPKLAPLALLNAGVSALEAGRTTAAETYLRTAPPGDTEAEARRSELTQKLTATRDAALRAERSALVSEGAAALEQKQFALARTKLEQALRRAPDLSDEERADLHFGIGTAAAGLGDLEAARQHFETAADLAPSDPDASYQAARVADQQGELNAAEARYEASLGRGLVGPEAVAARARLEQLSPLPPSGWSGWVGVSGGYDTNPDQSGVADTTGVSGGRQTRGSPFVGLGAEIEPQTTLTRSWSAGAFYSLYALALLDSPVQDLSVQGHEAGPRVYWTPTRSVRMRFTASAGLYLAGLREIEPFVWDVTDETRVDLFLGSILRTRVEVELRRSQGLAGYGYLTGLRTDLRLSEQLRLDPLRIELGVRYRINDIGTQSEPVSNSDFSPGGQPGGPTDPQDGTQVDTYVIPLAYTAPMVFANLDLDLTSRWALGLSAQLERRSYEASHIESATLPENRKERRDTRLGGGLSSESALDEDAHWLFVVTYDVLSSQSNMGVDQYDYEDRNYVQQIVEVGLEAHL